MELQIKVKARKHCLIYLLDGSRFKFLSPLFEAEDQQRTDACNVLREQIIDQQCRG
jgi:hypothetical protein